MLITIIYIGSSNNLLQDVVKDYEKRIKNIGRNIGLKEIIYIEIKNSNKKNTSEKKDEEQEVSTTTTTPVTPAAPGAKPVGFGKKKAVRKSKGKGKSGRRGGRV